MIILADKVQQIKNKGIKHLFEGEFAVDFIPLILVFHYDSAIRPPTIAPFFACHLCRGKQSIYGPAKIRAYQWWHELLLLLRSWYPCAMEKKALPFGNAFIF